MSTESSPQSTYQPTPADRRRPPMPRVEKTDSESEFTKTQKALALVAMFGVAVTGTTVNYLSTNEGSANVTITDETTAVSDICKATIEAAQEAEIPTERAVQLTKRAAGIDSSMECPVTFNDMVHRYDIPEEGLTGLNITVTVKDDLFGATAEAKPTKETE